MANSDTCAHGQPAGRCIVCGKERKLSSEFPEMRLQALRNRIPGLGSLDDSWGKASDPEPTIGPNRDFLQDIGGKAKRDAEESIVSSRTQVSTERTAKMLASIIGRPLK